MKKARSIMIQGTMSNAGKSLLAAGLCRIFYQDGYRTAPFKSQNMALNSFITKEGLEMGRAQVMQAEAAGIEPEARMNPILLKPTTDTGSQVIVNGEVLTNMSAVDYYKYKKELRPLVQKAYDSLASEYDIIVLEGAGSPAEINLKADDLVNMGMAKMAGAPVLLAGDIDRGGVFAQLLGTQMLLEKDEQEILKGLIINKFRGDVSILMPGVRMIEEKCGKPVVGVVPYMELDVDDEDSLSERLLDEYGTKSGAKVDIAVIRIPHISNFTDFNALSGVPGAEVRYVRHVEALGHPDMIILPGTKNTMGDLRWLRESGMETAILKCRERGSVIFGVCGGFQMLGEELHDPYGTEEGGSMRGLGLLPTVTRFAREKTRTRVTGTVSEAVDGALKGLAGHPVEGYEIHMGRSARSGSAEAVALMREMAEESGQSGYDADGAAMTRITDAVTGEGKADGFFKDDVYGTYIHGFFDSEDMAAEVVSLLARKKGVTLEPVSAGSLKAYKEQQYDHLADVLRAHLDMPAIYRILEEGI